MTVIHAVQTEYTARFMPHNFLFITNAFRVMAPGALQRTTFEKNRRADAGAIVDGKGFYVEYGTCKQRTSPSCCYVKYKDKWVSFEGGRIYFKKYKN
jgi:hypothetical protein